jgi:hypothetical protein
MRWCWLERTHVLPERHMCPPVQLLLPVQVDCDDRRRLYSAGLNHEDFSLWDASNPPSVHPTPLFHSDLTIFRQSLLFPQKIICHLFDFYNDQINSRSCLPVSRGIDPSNPPSESLATQVKVASAQPVFQAWILRSSQLDQSSPFDDDCHVRFASQATEHSKRESQCKRISQTLKIQLPDHPVCRARSFHPSFHPDEKSGLPTAKQKSKTYNRRDSQMVTHSSTSRPVQCLCMAERTECQTLTL